MKKFLVTTLCIFAVYLISFKLVPGLFPGISKLNDYEHVQVSAIKNNNFTQRIDTLNTLLDKSNKNGSPYVINNVQKLNDVSASASNAAPTSPISSSLIAKNNSLDKIDINAVQLTQVGTDQNKQPSATFSINGQSVTSGVGIIGNSDVMVDSIDSTGGKVTLKQGSNQRIIVLDQINNKINEINNLSTKK
jgi:IMP cyclohydrolase